MPIITDNFDAFGLDIGDRSLKAAHVKQRGRSNQLDSYGLVEVPRGVFERGIIKKPSELVLLVKKLLANMKGKPLTTPYVNACLPEIHTFIKLITLTASHEEELPAALREALPSHIPVEADRLYLDWHVVNRRPATNEYTLLVGAVPQDIADSYTAALLAAGLQPVSLQIEAEAIVRALVPLATLPEEPIAIVDIGATRSSFICFERGVIQFTVSLPTSGEQITDLIQKKLELSYEEAERAKRLCGLDPRRCKGAVLQIAITSIEELAASLQQNIDFFSHHVNPEKRIEHLLLCGGGAHFSQLKDVLAKKIPGVTASEGNPFTNLTNNARPLFGRRTRKTVLNLFDSDLSTRGVAPQISQDSRLMYTTAIGLALARRNH